MITIEDGYLKYKCGCKFKVVGTDPEMRLRLGLVTSEVNEECPLTWDMLCNDNIKGIFQLESSFGQQYTRRLKPRNIEHLSALSAILRPGALNAIEDGKSVSEHYIDRKNGVEENVCKYPALEPILNKTFNCLIYQEQSMKIAQEIAGFSLQEADVLRKGIGKKKADIIAGLKQQFIDGCIKVGKVNEEEAKEIFAWIEASQRYQFNACLDPSMVVTTKDGMKILDEVEVGDFVLAPKSVNEDHFVEVLDVIDSGTKDVYEIELEDGEILRCTLDHKIMCQDQKMRTLQEIIEQDLEIMVYNT